VRQVESIMVLRLGALGDVVLCEPAVAALAARYPAARIDLVTRARYAELYRAHPAVHAVCTLETAPPRPDLAVDLHNRFDTRRLALRARRRVHWRKRRGVDLVYAALGRPLHRDYRGGPHQVERISAALGMTTRRAPRIHLTQAWRQAAAPLAPAGCVVILPAASRAVKRWPLDRFRACAAALAAEGLPVRVAGGPGEEGSLRAVAGDHGVVVGVQTSLGVLGAVFERAAVVVGNDTGLLHLAAAVGTRVVGVFGPTPPGRWGPPPDRGEVVTLDPACGPCSDHGARPCRARRRTCLDDLQVERVLAAVSSCRDKSARAPQELHTGVALETAPGL